MFEKRRGRGIVKSKIIEIKLITSWDKVVIKNRRTVNLWLKSCTR